MPHGADLKTIRREIAFSAILITGMLLEIWITLYREFNYDFSNTPEILPIAQYHRIMYNSFIYWYNLVWIHRQGCA